MQTDDHPLFSNDAETWHEWVRGIKREAWNQFKERSPADVEAVIGRLSELESEKQKLALDLRNGGDREGGRSAKIVQRRAKHRRDVLEALLEYVALYGPDEVPGWGDTDILATVSAREAGKYGKSSTVQKRRLQIERYLDENHPGWVDGNVSLEVRKKIASNYDNISHHAIKDDIQKHLRRMRRS